MTGDLFVDTGAWFAIEVPNDRWHKEAVDTLRTAILQRARLVPSNWILGETYTLLLYECGHAAAWRFRETIVRSARLRVVSLDDTIERDAYALLRRYDDQQFSWVDGVSFAIMRKER